MKNTILRVFSSHFLAGGLILGGVVMVHLHLPKSGVMVIATGFLLALYRGTVGHIVTLARQLAHDAMQGRWPQQPLSTTTAQLPMWLELIWFTIFVVGVFAFFIPLFSGNAHASMIMMQGLGIVVSVLGAYEWRLRLQRLWQRSWALPLGKFLIAMLAGVFLCVTTAQARQFTYALTGENPDAFPTFVRLLSFALMPLLCFSVACMVAMLWAVVEAARTGLDMLAHAADTKLKAWKGLLLARSDDVVDAPSNTIDRMHKAIRMLRPVSMLLAIVWLMAVTPDVDPDKHPAVHAVALAVLTHMDYWPQQVCGHTSNDRAARLDDSHYSIATTKESHITLHTESCPNVPGIDRSEASATHTHSVIASG